jgi:phasin family protein
MAEDRQQGSQLGGGGGSSQTPAFDFTKMLQQFQIPGVDFASIIERERKNIEALAEANRIAFEGWQNLVRRQSEILQDSMKRAVDDAKNQTALKNGAELARSAFETALANMRELAEMASKSQKEAFEVIRKRVEENMNALRGKKPEDGQKS